MLKRSQLRQVILITQVIAMTMFMGCDEDAAISGTSYSGPAAVFHSETRYLDADSSSCLNAPLPWDELQQLPHCQIEVEYFRESKGTDFVPFPCPALTNGTWSDSWQSLAYTKIGDKVGRYDVAHCLLSPAASPLNCSDSEAVQSTDSEAGINAWHYCENDTAVNDCQYRTVVSSPLAEEIVSHPENRNGIKLFCSQSSPPPPSNGANGFAIGDACAAKSYISESSGLLSPSGNVDDALFWLEAQAPQCSQGLCLSTVRRSPDVTLALRNKCESEGATIEECAAAGFVQETSACTCRCEDADGNRSEEDDSLCTCPDNMQCQRVEWKPSAFPEELRGGYCMAL